MRDLYALLAELAARGEPAALATVIRTARSAPRHEGSKLVVRADGASAGSVGGGEIEARVIAAAREVIADGRCRRLRFDLRGEVSVCGGEVEVFVEPLADAAPCWIFGAGHVGRAIVALGRDLPFRFTVSDDRPELLAGLEGAVPVVAGPAEAARRLRPTARTLVLCANRSHELDAASLQALFAAEREAGVEVAWTGVIGSGAKAAHLRRRFAADPGAAARWQRVTIPVGLAIGAETPAELALSILAELLAVTRGAPPMPGADGRPAGVWHQRNRPVGRGDPGPEFPGAPDAGGEAPA